MLGHNAKA